MPRDCFDCLCCLSNVFVIFRCKLLLVVCCILTTTSVWVIRMNANSRGNNGVPNTTFNVTHLEMVEDSDKATPAIEMQSEVPIPKVEMNIPSKKSDVTEEKIDEAAVNYRFTKKSAIGMGLVACAAVFGR